MGVVSLVGGLKLVFSVYLTGLLPQSWMNRNESDYVLHTLEPALETADLAMVLALQVLLNLVFPKAIASSLGRKGGVAAVAAVFLIGCGLVAWPIRGSSTLVATLCISAFAQFYLQQIALSLSVAVGKGLARFKLLGTVGGQAFQLAALFVPALSTPTSLVIILGLSCGLLLHGILDQRSLGDKEQRKTVSTVVLSTTMEKRVTWLWAFLFVVVAFVGLGSEQILDARLKVSLRVAQAFGAHGHSLRSNDGSASSCLL
jgi:hypothetical protein